MQEEHRQLLEEMETLRLRAAELTRLNAQRQHLRQSTEEVEMSQESTSSQVVASRRQHLRQSTEEVQVSQESTSSQVVASAELEALPSSSSPPAEPTNQEATPIVQEEDEEDNEETASYLQAKLNEIANLKAQFKRVQNMVDTTKMIEQHMSTRQVVQTSSVQEYRSAPWGLRCRRENTSRRRLYWAHIVGDRHYSKWNTRIPHSPRSGRNHSDLFESCIGGHPGIPLKQDVRSSRGRTWYRFSDN